MATLTQTTDQQARVNLPRSFANATVIIEEISETEIRIRKASYEKSEDLFVEETEVLLSDTDRDRFLQLLDNPPSANESLRKLAQGKQDG